MICGASRICALWLLLAMSQTADAADRRIEGTVTYKGGEPAANAAVQVEDTETLQVLSHLTDRDGHFQFLALNADKEYLVRATKNGYRSKPHTISKFSSRSVEIVSLVLVPAK